MPDLPPLTSPWTRIPTIHETTDLFTDPTMDALDVRYGGGPGGIIPDASTTVKGIVELATDAETTTGTD